MFRQETGVTCLGALLTSDNITLFFLPHECPTVTAQAPVSLHHFFGVGCYFRQIR